MPRTRAQIATGEAAYDAVVVVTPKKYGDVSRLPSTPQVTVSTNNGTTWSAPHSPRRSRDGKRRVDSSVALPRSGIEPDFPELVRLRERRRVVHQHERHVPLVSRTTKAPRGRPTWPAATVRTGGKTITGKPVTDASKAALRGERIPEHGVLLRRGSPRSFSGRIAFCYRSTDGRQILRTHEDQRDRRRAGTTRISGGPEPSAPTGRSTSRTVRTPASPSPVSQDEGDSWHDVNRHGVGRDGQDSTKLFEQQRRDRRGRQTCTRRGSTTATFLPYVSASKDHGRDVDGAADDRHAGRPAASAYVDISVKEAGHVAVAYYGSPDLSVPDGGDGYFSSDGRDYDAYPGRHAGSLRDGPGLLLVGHQRAR